MGGLLVVFTLPLRATELRILPQLLGAQAVKSQILASTVAPPPPKPALHGDRAKKDPRLPFFL